MIREEEIKSYVFDLGLGRQTKVKVWVKGSEEICEIGEKEIETNC